MKILASATLIACWLLVVLGDTVRVTDSGMGCRSWPLCNGSAGLSGSYHALLEQSHRYGAALVTILVSASLLAVRRGARENLAGRRAASAAVGLIGVQIVLGAITVLSHNAGWTVALHLTGAWLLLGAVTVTAVTVLRGAGARTLPRRGGPQRICHRRRPTGCSSQLDGVGLGRPRSGPIAVIAVLLAAVSGMLVLHGQASRACPSWPLCLSATAAPRLIALQYIHRTIALLASAALIACALITWRASGAGSAGRTLSVAALGLLALTAAFGGVVASTGAPELAQDVHLALGSSLWACAVALAALQRLGAAPAGTEKIRGRDAAGLGSEHARA